MILERTIGILLGAGKIDESLIPVFGDISSASIPLNGRPAIFYNIDFMILMGVQSLYISIGYKKEKIREYIEFTYGKRISITFVEVDYQTKPGMSLLEVVRSIHQSAGDCKVLVMLADTLVPIEQLELQDYRTSFVLTSRKYEFSERWCVVDRDDRGFIHAIYDKVKHQDGLEALIGVYFFTNPEIWVEFEDVGSGVIEISKLMEYSIQSGKSIRASVCETWFDLGHLDMYQKAKKEFLYHRYFNFFHHDENLGTITKRSRNRKKIEDEVRWVEQLPGPLHVLTPRLIRHGSIGEEAFVEMEYYGYPPLSELWLYGTLGKDIWLSILARIFKVVELFVGHPRDVSFAQYDTIYHVKTMERIREAQGQTGIFNKMFEETEFVLNQQPVLGWPHIKPFIQEYYSRLYNPRDHCVIHGDLCFSNILYDLRSGIIRLLDPRGHWGENFGSGDIKYDLAKLRHSISGDYDYIVQDLFSIEMHENVINFLIASQNEEKHAIKKSFDDMIAIKWKLRDIQFIEGLLFLSMIPLHQDNRQRQLAMFFKGIGIMNDVMKNCEQEVE